MAPFLGLQRSVDGGRLREPVATDGIVGCLTREPATDRIWACGRGRPMQWVAARSDDLGRTWDVALARYADLVGTWTAPPTPPPRGPAGYRRRIRLPGRRGAGRRRDWTRASSRSTGRRGTLAPRSTRAPRPPARPAATTAPRHAGGAPAHILIFRRRRAL
ncbi:MAG: hypothetical protein R3F43_21995 [bacterium]